MIIDSSFKDIKTKTSVNNADVIVSNKSSLVDTWHIKTVNGSISSVISKVAGGMKIEAYFPVLGYLYVRQILSDIRKYEGKKFKLIVEISRDSWQPLNYDVYITNRYSSDDNNRINVIDTDTKPLVRGSNHIEVDFEVPKDTTRIINDVNGLSIAFRLIGNTQNTACTINSIELYEVVEESSVKLTENQYNLIVEKLKELL